MFQQVEVAWWFTADDVNLLFLCTTYDVAYLSNWNFLLKKGLLVYFIPMLLSLSISKPCFLLYPMPWKNLDILCLQFYVSLRFQLCSFLNCAMGVTIDFSFWMPCWFLCIPLAAWIWLRLFAFFLRSLFVYLFSIFLFFNILLHKKIKVHC